MASHSAVKDTAYTECGMDGLPCLTSEFAKGWLDDLDTIELPGRFQQQPGINRTLRQQYEVVAANMIANIVSRYGDLSIENELIAAFQGSQPQKIQRPVDRMQHARPHVLQEQLSKLKKPVNIKAQKKRQYLDEFMKELIFKLFNTTEKQQRVLNTPSGPIKHPECHSKMLEAFHQKCFNFNKNPYAAEYSSVLSNICSEGVNVDTVIKKMIDHCQGITVTNIE
ncbi:unnamed protein product [Anisakis simplex]|uniref:Legumain (inferred by orthology to a human protein) n=1 Tax=Anisakis simplex TaxID=6269 RepID=A0A0M3KBT5_ANISI|nr:unnamed protein product [Anisakis simplex]